MILSYVGRSDAQWTCLRSRLDRKSRVSQMMKEHYISIKRKHDDVTAYQGAPIARFDGRDRLHVRARRRWTSLVTHTPR